MTNILLRWKWRTRRTLKSIGLPGATGCGLLAVALVFYCTVLLPAQARLQENHTQLLSLKEQARQLGRITPKPAPNRQVQLVGFLDSFSPLNSLPAELGKIYRAAEHENLQLAQGEYRLVQDKPVKLAHYQIRLPVKGSYTQIRRFLSAVLAEVPGLSLENVSFQRQKIGDVALNAEIKLTLHLRETDDVTRLTAAEPKPPQPVKTSEHLVKAASADSQTVRQILGYD